MGIQDLTDRILILLKYLFFRVCHGLLTSRSELNMWCLTYCYLLEEKYQALHFAIMKYPFRMNYAATDLCIYK